MKKILLLCLLALLPLLPVFQQGYLAYTDAPTRQAEALTFLEAMHNGWISGWSYTDYAGMPSHVYQYQTGFWLLGLLVWLFGLALGYKVFLVVVYAFVGIATYIFLHRVYPKSALVGSVLVLLHTQLLNRILEGVWAELIGFAFLLLLITTLLKARHNIALASALFGLIILFHLYAAIAAVIVVCCMAWVYNNPRMLLCLFLGGGMTTFYWYPFLETAHWLVPYATAAPLWFNIKQWGYLLGKSGLSVPHSILLSIPSMLLFGLALFGYRKTRFVKAMLLSSSIMLFFSLGLWQVIDLPLLSSLIPERFLLYVRIGIIALAGSTLARFDWQPKPAVLVLLFVLLPVALPQAWFSTVPEDYIAVWKFVDNAQGRVLLDDTTGEYTGNLMPLAHAFANIEAIGGFTHNPRMPMANVVDFSGNKWFGKEGISKTEFLRWVHLFNIQYIITKDKPPAGKLVMVRGPLKVYTVPFTNSLVEGKGKIISVSPQKIVVDAEGPITLKFQYHPYWTADKGTLTQGNLGFMHLDAKGRTTLTYHRFNKNNIIVSVFFLAGILFYSLSGSSTRWTSAT